MQVIITMAGLGQRFKNQGFQDPKPFVQIKEKTVIEYLTEKFPKHWKLFFVVNEDLESKYIEFLNQKFENSQIIKTKFSERGPIDTVLAAKSFVSELEPTLVSYCDFSLEWDSKDFEFTVLNQKADAAVIGYTGFQKTFLGPNTYCHYLVKNNLVTELQEKKLYTGKLETEWTSSGLYYFKSAQFLYQCLEMQLKQNLSYAGKDFYVSLALQAALNLDLKGALKILNYPIQTFYQFGTPKDIELFLKG